MFFSFFSGFLKLFFSEIILTNSTIFLFFSIQKMDFILNEAIEENNDFKLVFSDESDGELFEEEGGELNFINDTIEEEETQDEPFYWKVDNQPLKFLNQTRNFNEVLQNEDHKYYGDDDLPKLFDPENREEVDFDTSEKNDSKATNFRKSLLQFETVVNLFYCSVIYGLLYNKSNERFNIKLSDNEKFLGINLFTDLKKIEKKTMLNHSIFGYFDQCQLINETLSEYFFFF